MTINKKMMKRLTIALVPILILMLLGFLYLTGAFYKTKIPAALMYHSISDRSAQVSAKNFEKQMKYLSENGYTFLFSEEIRDCDKYEKPIIITFDDGYRDNYDAGFDILKKYNAKATIYMITDYIGKDGFLTEEQIKEMEESGLVRVDPHTHNDTDLSQLTSEHIHFQIEKSNAVLKEITGREPKTFAYPYGGFDEESKEIAAEYYEVAFAVENGSQKDLSAVYRKSITNRCMLFNMRAFKKYTKTTR